MACRVGAPYGMSPHAVAKGLRCAGLKSRMAVGLCMQPHAVDSLTSQVGEEAFDHRRKESSKRMVLLRNFTRLVKMKGGDIEGSTVESV